MKLKSKHSFSYIINNKNEAPTAGWHLVGGTGFTMNSLFCSQTLNQGEIHQGCVDGCSLAYKAEVQQPCVCMQHTVPSKVHAIQDQFGISSAGISVTLETIQIQIHGPCLLTISTGQFQQD